LGALAQLGLRFRIRDCQSDQRSPLSDDALIHTLRVPFGYWQAKDEKDDDMPLQHTSQHPAYSIQDAPWNSTNRHNGKSVVIERSLLYVPG
jgi:hypothetical protein